MGEYLKQGIKTLTFAFSTTYCYGDGPNVCYGRKTKCMLYCI